MDYYTILGMVVVALIALIGICLTMYSQVKKSTLESKEPIYKLDNTITQLTEEIRHMREFDQNRDKRIEKHGREIDSLKNTVTEGLQDHEIKLLDHENRIKNIEKGK